MKKLKVEYLKKEDLKPYVNNAKKHSPEQVESIKNSIKRFGFNDPIAVWKDNIVIEGHGRLLAVMEMEDIKEVPVIRLDSLSDKERKAYTIAHNKLTMNTGFEGSILGDEIKSIMDEIDMTDFGFGDFELTMLTEDFEPELYDDTEIEGYEEIGEEKLAGKRVIITYNNGEEKELCEYLGIKEEELKVKMKLENLLNKSENYNTEKM